MSWSITFYSGVEEDLLSLPPKIQARMIRLLELMETHGPNLGPPHTKSIGNGLFELRAKAQEGIARGLFCYLNGERICVLSVFVKKTQKIPQNEIEIARKRLAEVKTS
ncbi:type II toxin-antitoxin system RelE/ParE family toxin [Pseudidiomarina sp. GXY010]|uniref:Type II toxin-antitoxin system RelE/ParE family toxin n=1 Tax=Pseudidiomarina fusca TaxID=2965078 RepID=A0ABU3KZX8_9GAMM|nr:type II toxin-antitoxin system RelE/ParE family toxin [Pseudidiomarina sp. GXY010]MDT7526716.1 type II toxin-antitoxin system RelE/ParE family toxin [Pseudidiomarina sp. GXY010]